MKTKAETHYSPGHQSAHCGGDGKFGTRGMCRHYLGRLCEIVAGQIDPDYWCEEWDRRPRMSARHLRKK